VFGLRSERIYPPPVEDESCGGGSEWDFTMISIAIALLLFYSTIQGLSEDGWMRKFIAPASNDAEPETSQADAAANKADAADGIVTSSKHFCERQRDRNSGNSKWLRPQGALEEHSHTPRLSLLIFHTRLELSLQSSSLC